jgi:hypothetical protein
VHEAARPPHHDEPGGAELRVHSHSIVNMLSNILIFRA